MVNRNRDAFKNALQIALAKVERFTIQRLATFGEMLLDDAKGAKRGWNSFTGNTITSLAFGVYENGSLTDIVFVSGVKPPVHAKIQNGETLYLENPYEGESRAVTGRVDIYDAWGDETSVQTLSTLRPKNGNGIIITTGTEYSEFLERKRDFNVLSDTQMYARVFALSWMKSNLNPDTSI